MHLFIFLRPFISPLTLMIYLSRSIFFPFLSPFLICFTRKPRHSYLIFLFWNRFIISTDAFTLFFVDILVSILYFLCFSSGSAIVPFLVTLLIIVPWILITAALSQFGYMRIIPLIRLNIIISGSELIKTSFFIFCFLSRIINSFPFCTPFRSLFSHLILWLLLNAPIYAPLQLLM